VLGPGLRAAIVTPLFREDPDLALRVLTTGMPAQAYRKLRPLLCIFPAFYRFRHKIKAQRLDQDRADVSDALDRMSRELQNVVERAVILCDGETFCVDEAWLTRVAPKAATATVPLVASLVEREKEMVETALREAEGVVGGPTGAAAKLGIPRQTLESKIRKLGINRHRFKAS